MSDLKQLAALHDENLDLSRAVIKLSSEIDRLTSKDRYPSLKEMNNCNHARMTQFELRELIKNAKNKINNI